MTWFEELTGISETSPEHVRGNLTVDQNRLTSHANGRSWVCGQLEIPTLAELRRRASSVASGRGGLTVREVVANVQHLHRDESNAGALFQVASQFNLLEMVSPDVTPEQGVGIYERDLTQGPACAIAAGAGTIYRNYFAIVNGRAGQTRDHQIDCLAGIGSLLGNVDGRLWKMQNGYALPSADGLEAISRRLKDCPDDERDRLRQALRIGIHWQTQVTLEGTSHVVSQAYCSALPVAYSAHSPDRWEAFAKLILDAAYEATFCAAILNSARTGNNQLFLTLIGGGAFGNDTDWIIDSLRRAIRCHAHSNLDVAIVSYGTSNPHVDRLVRAINGK